MWYPIIFKPIYIETIWGGRKLEQILHKKNMRKGNIGESWEICDVENNVSKVENGKFKGLTIRDLCSQYGSDFLGKHVFETYGTRFPLLIKFIDAAQDLSVQVHPDDTFAEANHGSKGKTELWYIIDSEPNTSLISGFSSQTNPEQYLQKLSEQRISELLNRVPVKRGDVFFIPPGRVHTIGKGILLAEIQQSSDLTYRIYDWERKDKNGKSRELHLDKALQVLDFKAARETKTLYDPYNDFAELSKNQYFTVNKLQLSKPVFKHYAELDSFVVLMGISGEVQLKYGNKSMNISSGKTILIPSQLSDIQLIPKERSELLEVYV